MVLESDMDISVAIDLLLPEVKLEQTMALLWFCQIVAEEVSKHDPRRMSTTGILDRLTPNLTDIMDMLQYYLSQSIQEGSATAISVGQETLNTLHSWIKLSHHTWITEETYSRPISALIPVVIECIPVPGLTQIATDVICDIIKEWSRLINADNHHSIRSLLLGPFGKQQVTDLQSGDFEGEKMSFASLILEYVGMQANQFGKQSEGDITPLQNFVSGELLEYCHKLLQCQGTPYIEDDVCIMAVTVWIDVIGLLDDTPARRGSDWLQDMKEHIVRAIHECVQKLRLPSNEVVIEWDQEQTDGFASFRREASEVLELAYWFLQQPGSNELFNFLVHQLALASFAASDWEGLEVSLYCLNAVAEFVLKGENNDDALESFLGRGVFAELANTGERVSIPAYKTAIRWVGEYAAFFKRRPHLLPSALSFLFSMLPSPALADSTAKAISHLCDSARTNLVQHIDELISAFEKFRVLPTANPYVKEKLIKAISTVGQALGSNEAKAKYLEYIIVQFEEGARTAHEIFLQNQMEESSTITLEVLRCLKIVGKSFQEPSVDLEDLEPKVDFWSQGAGQSVQSRIFNLLQLPFVIRQGDISIELLETACGTFNSGLTENSGPFRLPAPNIATFICRCDSTDSLCTALSTANALVSAHSVATSPRIDQEVSQIFLHVTSTVLRVPSQSEPDLVHEALNFFSCMCQKYMNILFETTTSLNGSDSVVVIDLLSNMLSSCLSSDDPRPKRAAAALWIRLLDKPKGPADIPNRAKWLTRNGPDLTGWLIWNFAGGASRSHIEFLLAVFTKMIFGYTMQMKAWIESAFRSEVYWPQNAKATEQERRVWAAKVLALRGRRKETREVVEEFWLTCRGTAFRYTS
jgi:hypothetical protein